MSKQHLNKKYSTEIFAVSLLRPGNSVIYAGVVKGKILCGKQTGLSSNRIGLQYNQMKQENPFTPGAAFFKAEKEVTEHHSMQTFLSFVCTIYSSAEDFPVRVVDTKCPRSAGVLLCG